MEKFWRKKALLLKTESTYGVDAVPTGGANAMLGLNVRLRPIIANRVQRNLDKPFFGGQGSILVNTHVGLDFEIEIAGGGAVDAAPKYGPAHRACALAETIVPTTGPVTYDPVSAALESTSIYLNVDGVNHPILGARGNLALSMRIGEVPVWRYSMLGLFAAPSDTALPTIDTTGFQDPLPLSKTNTPTVTVHGYSANLAAFELDLGNVVAGHFRTKTESILTRNRNVTGRFTIDADALATFDPFARAVARTPGAVQVLHGTAAGNRVQIDMAITEIGEPEYVQDNDVVGWAFPFEAIPSDTGNDEIKFTMN